MAAQGPVAGDRRLAQRLHREPAAHRMCEHVDLADAWRLAEVVQERLQRVARGGGAVLVADVAEELAARRPGEEDRDAAEMRVGDDLGGARARIVETGVEAMHEDEDVAIDPDPPRHMRSELGAELVAVELALAREHDVVLAVGLAPWGSLDRARAMAGRDRHCGQRETG